jgi:hypothetical protein
MPQAGRSGSVSSRASFILDELGAQDLARAVNLDFDLWQAPAHELGDIFISKAMVEPQEQYGAPVLREERERAVDDAHGLATEELILRGARRARRAGGVRLVLIHRAVGKGAVGLLSDNASSSAASPSNLKGDVARDAEEPSDRSVGGAEAVDPPERAREGLLGGVSGLGAIADHVAQKAMNRA